MPGETTQVDTLRRRYALLPAGSSSASTTGLISAVPASRCVLEASGAEASMTSTVLAPIAGLSVFERIVVGIDATPESLEAARQAAVLRAPEGTLHLLAVVQTAKAVHAGFAAGGVADQMLTEAQAALERAE